MPEGVIFARAYRDARRDLRQLTAGITTIISSNDQFNEAACRATADLYMLATAPRRASTPSPASPGTPRCSAATASSRPC